MGIRNLYYSAVCVLCFFVICSPVFAAACTGLPSIGNQSISNCTLTIAEVTGSDQANNSETSTANTATLSVNSGAAVTINAGGILATGSVILGGGTIAIATGGTINPNIPIYIADADADGWASAALSGATLYTASASGRRRMSLMRGTAADCGEGTYSMTNQCCAVSGGTITYTDSSGLNPRSSPQYSGGYTVRTFTGNGTLIVTGCTITATTFMVAGGGGAGCTWSYGGGGGGGGGVIQTSRTLASGSYPIVIGVAGPNHCGSQASAANGGNTTFNGLTAIGGGGGAHVDVSNGANGGSGGGGSVAYWNGYNVPGNGTAGQGNNGGYGGTVFTGGPDHAAGGGGGAGQIGGNWNGRYGGNGGNGIVSSISGTSKYYAGGGRGGYSNGLGGFGYGVDGLGAGGTNIGGGGASWDSGTGATTAYASAGVVILRYPNQ